MKVSELILELQKTNPDYEIVIIDADTTWTLGKVVSFIREEAKEFCLESDYKFIKN